MMSVNGIFPLLHFFFEKKLGQWKISVYIGAVLSRTYTKYVFYNSFDLLGFLLHKII